MDRIDTLMLVIAVCVAVICIWYLGRSGKSMTRIDAFMLGMTIFLAANCGSYFVRSGVPYATGWGQRPGSHDLFEAVGFPFVMFSLANGSLSWPWINWGGNLLAAGTASYVLAGRLACRLPPLWAGYSRTFRYSLCGLLAIPAIVCLLLGVALLSTGTGLAARNLACLGGPAAVYCWFLYRRTIGWTWLAVAGVGLTLLVLAIDLSYGGAGFFGPREILEAVHPLSRPTEHGSVAECIDYGHRARARCLVGVTVTRAVVPVFGVLSLLTLIDAGSQIFASWRVTPHADDRGQEQD